EVVKPEQLPNEAEIKERVLPLMPDPVRRYYERERPIEWRPVELDRYLGKKIENGRFHVWIRATAKLPDEPAIHQCVLAYASDMLLLDSALIPHGRTVVEKTLMAASLDHARRIYPTCALNMPELGYTRVRVVHLSSHERFREEDGLPGISAFTRVLTR